MLFRHCRVQSYPSNPHRTILETAGLYTPSEDGRKLRKQAPGRMPRYSKAPWLKTILKNLRKTDLAEE